MVMLIKTRLKRNWNGRKKEKKRGWKTFLTPPRFLNNFHFLDSLSLFDFSLFLSLSLTIPHLKLHFLRHEWMNLLQLNQLSWPRKKVVRWSFLLSLRIGKTWPTNRSLLGSVASNSFSSPFPPAHWVASSSPSPSLSPVTFSLSHSFMMLMLSKLLLLLYVSWITVLPLNLYLLE